MNTKKIGDEFESRGLEIINRVIQEEQLGHTAKFLKIIPQAPYYSHSRKKNVIFDMVIEVWPPGATRYTLIYIIECKNYQKRIPVEKIKSFLFDVNEIGFANAKGIFISNSPLQEAAYNLADSKGMMVIEGESAENYKIVLYKTNRNTSSPKIPFIEGTENVNLIDTGGGLIEKLIDQQLLSALQENINPSQISYGIDRLSKEDIEQAAHAELDKMNPQILLQAYHISPKSFSEFLQRNYGIDVISLDSDLLGSCDFGSNIIGINKNIVSTSRELFIMAHEFGHFVLHQRLHIGQQTYERFNDSEYDFSTGKHQLNNVRHWIEWQANYFASCFVLPTVPFFVRLKLIQQNIGKSIGKIYVDDEYQNQKDFNDIVSKLAYRFSVSKTTVIYKLNELNLINNHSRMKTIGVLIAEYRDGLFT
jgi:Zn-dependent peptidase ImmA (M78 family)